MADPIYTSAAVLAIDAQGKPVAGAEFAAYAPEDTAFTTPLTVSDPVTGAPINPLKAGANGALPAFTVAGNHPRVILKSGSFSTEVVALQQLVADRVAAAGLDTVTVQAAITAGTTAADAASDAEQAKTDAVQAKTDAVAAAGTATTKAAEVAAVVATNDGIMTAVAQDPESAFSAELSATIGAAVAAGAAGSFRPTFPDDEWVFFGHSLVAGGFGEAFAALTGVTIYNGGIGGQVASQVAARWNTPSAKTTAPATIPATGAVTLALDVNPVRDGSQYDRAAFFGGVEGMIQQRGSTISFVRTYGGRAVIVPSGSAVEIVEGYAYRSRTAVLWIGRNSSWSTPTARQAIVDTLRDMVAALTPRFRRVLIMEEPPFTGDNLTNLESLNALIEAEFPNEFVRLMTWMRTTDAADAAGITFSTQDNTDRAAGLTPTSFRYDGGHLNATGYVAAAKKLRAEAAARGWMASSSYPTPPMTLSALYLPASWKSGTSKWEDASGNGNDLSVISGYSAPALVTESSVARLRFTGVEALRNTALTVPQPATIYMLARVTGLPTSGRHVGARLNNSTDLWLPSVSPTATGQEVRIRVETNDTVAQNTHDTSWHLFGLVLNSATSLAIFDAVESAKSYGSTGVARVSLGVTNGGEVAGFIGDIAALAIAPAALDSMGRAALVAYLKAQTGIA